ncbi:ATP-grasp fold amidoligase family protein, partial [Brachyspira hyodysenteriae]|uniref:ATP-grasp fold amidoligase family protein n=1 Tax=Brachyspira hyodysenteriae TaxID=159 RepID=UPI0023A98E3B
MKEQFKNALGYELNLENPKTFNEKLQWLKLYYHDPLMTICADKYAVREYIKETIGEEYLIPLIGVWDRVEDIDFNSLPNQFV